MSQSTKKEDTAKKTLLFLLIFAVICIGVTVALTYNTIQIRKNNANIEENNSYREESKNKEHKNIEPVSLTEKYYTNGLKIKRIEENFGDIVETYPSGENLMQCEISYPQISGLKNVTIEENINKEIKEKVYSLRNDNLFEDPNVKYYRIDASVFGNFSDVLSVEIYFEVYMDATPENNYNVNYKTEIYGLNYRLDTGEKLKFEDVFMPNTSMKSVIRNGSYEHLAWQYAYESEAMGADFDNINYGKIEEETFKYVAEYIKNPNIEFCFTPTTVIAIINNNQIYMEMQEMTDWIAIYTAYRTDNLYKDSKIQREMYAYADSYLSDSVIESKLKLSNFYYEIIAYPQYTDEGIFIKDEYDTEVAKKVIEKVYEKVKHYEEVANQNPEKAYILSINYYYDNSEDGKPYYSYYGYMTEMDKEYFKEHYEELVAEGRRTITGDVSAIDYAWLVDEEDKDKVVFYESFNKYTSIGAEDENEPEDVVTKEQRQKEMEEWETYENS